jgi:ribonuclease HII
MDFKEEQKLWKKGFKYVAGLDEAGRGPLAGPVVASAVLIDSLKAKEALKKLKGINDSKKLSAKKREELFSFITSYWFYVYLFNRFKKNWN